jgi:hypothetical protein
MRPTARFTSFLAFFAVFTIFETIASSPRAAQVAITANKDNTIFAESDTLSNGAGYHFFVGTNGLGDARRGLLAFDVSSSVPSGATIDSVALVLKMSKTVLASPVTIAVHVVNGDWGQAGSDALAQEGKGAPAEAGDATWGQSMFPGANWGTLGGDFAGTASASQSVADTTEYTWTSAAMATDVQGWLDAPVSNFGWIMVGNEQSIPTSRRFDTAENDTTSIRPTLMVWYTQVATAAITPPKTGFVLYPSVPNPFNPSTTISFETTTSGRVQVTVHDVSGAVVATLADETMSASRHAIEWNGRSRFGHVMSSGVYFVRILHAGEVRQQKITLVK